MHNRIKIFCFTLFVCLGISPAHVFSQQQLWYQKSGSEIGATMNIMVNQQGVIFASVYHQGIFRSLDTGTTWQQIAPYTDGVWTMAIRSTGEIIASLWSRGIFRSTNNGTSWAQLSSSKLNSDVRAVNALGEIFIESSGKLYYSLANDTGWVELPIHGGSISVANNIMFAAKGTTLHRSTNHGKQWTHLSDISSPIYSLVSEASGKIFVGTHYDNNVSTSSIFAYNTVSETWSENGPPSTINALIRRHDGVLFAASHDSGFYFSTNQGEDWRQYNIGLSSPKIFSLALLNDTTIVAGTLDGVFFSSGQLSSLLPVEIFVTTTPQKFSLEQNYPNPFNPSTTINFTIPRSGYTTLKIFDMLGKEIATLVNGHLESGRYSPRFDASSLASGIYFYSLRFGNNSTTRKMLLLR